MPVDGRPAVPEQPADDPSTGDRPDADRTVPVTERIRLAMGRGDYLLAYDEARHAVAEHPDDLMLRYQMILSLARSGATRRATDEIEALLVDVDLVGVPADLAEDLGALGAALAKDRALTAPDDRRAAQAAIAARAYESNYERHGRPYSCINAATMWLLAGDTERSSRLARRTLELTRGAAGPARLDRYWHEATIAEAHLVLGDLEGTAGALRSAALVPGVDVATRATTRRQLALVCTLLGVDADVLAPLRLPTVLHYCGHMIDPPGTGRFPAEAEGAVAAAIDDHLATHGVGFGHGSLACGADILVAETLLRRGLELHVVLPFDPADFERVSVAPGGGDWVERYRECLAHATSVLQATPGNYLDDDSLFGHCSAIAMGQAISHARSLATTVEQLAVWDGQRSSVLAGTAADVATWSRTGRPSSTVPIPGSRSSTTADEPASSPLGNRRVRAMLFGDIAGFSRLDDAEIMRFVEHVVQRLERTLDRFGGEILHQNTWGDGLYVVLTSVEAAARCALALQDTMRGIDLAAVGLPGGLGMRIGAHAGPVTMAHDPIIDRPGFYGVEVTRTARIEPATPPGDVYVTDVFAALLALEADPALRCEYVGRIPTAKDFGEFPMFVLKALD